MENNDEKKVKYHPLDIEDTKPEDLTLADIGLDENGESILEKEFTAHKPPQPPTLAFKSELFEWGEALVTSLTVVILLFVFCFRLIGVDGLSMYPSLNHKDQLIISNLFYTPKYGDIVVLTKESFMEEAIVKRVIATEGQTVDTNYDTNEVWVDGVLLDEPYVNQDGANTMHGDMNFPLTVPENCVLVMGDNRNHSSDSRQTRLGFVDERYILGRVLLRILPFDSFGPVDHVS